MEGTLLGPELGSAEGRELDTDLAGLKVGNEDGLLVGRSVGFGTGTGLGVGTGRRRNHPSKILKGSPALAASGSMQRGINTNRVSIV